MVRSSFASGGAWSERPSSTGSPTIPERYPLAWQRARASRSREDRPAVSAPGAHLPRPRGLPLEATIGDRTTPMTPPDPRQTPMTGTTQTIRIPIEGMTCDHCVGTVRRALEGVPGVRSALVDLAGKRAEVEAEGVDPSQLRQAVESAGYHVPDVASPPTPKLVSIGPIPPS